MARTAETHGMNQLHTAEQCQNCGLVILEIFEEPSVTLAACKRHKRSTELDGLCADWRVDSDKTLSCSWCVFYKEKLLRGKICTNPKSLFEGKDSPGWCIGHKIDIYKQLREAPGSLKAEGNSWAWYWVWATLLALPIALWLSVLWFDRSASVKLAGDATVPSSAPATLEKAPAALKDGRATVSPPLKSFEIGRASQPSRWSQPGYIPQNRSEIEEAARAYSGGDQAKEQSLREGLCAVYGKC